MKTNIKGRSNHGRNMNQIMQSPFNEHFESDSEEEDEEIKIYQSMGGLMNFPGTSIQMSSNFGGRGGTFKSTQYSYQTYIDENGKEHVKKMERSNNKHIDQFGNIMEDNQEFYKDSGKKFNKIKKGRRLNDRGMEITKENKNGEYSEYKHFHNMDEDDMGSFISDWKTKGNRIKKHYPNMMIQQKRNKPLAITYNQPKKKKIINLKTRKVLKKNKKIISIDNKPEIRSIKKKKKKRY